MPFPHGLLETEEADCAYLAAATQIFPLGIKSLADLLHVSMQ